MAETIPELEAGIFNGTLSDQLERPEVQEVIGTQILECYQAIAREKLKHDQAFRQSWINNFIARFHEWLKPPCKLFPAKAAINPKMKRIWLLIDDAPPSLVARYYQGDVTLRPDQVFSVRKWGIGFSFKDDTLDRFYMDSLIDWARRRLADNIKNLWNIEATYLSNQSNLEVEAKWSSGRLGGHFEHLMLEVLNEDASIARFAPLAEDILEKTDLRVQFPRVHQKLGSRVQVSLLADPAIHDQKVKALYFRDEFIILTPLELARCAIHPPSLPQFELLTRDDFWRPLGGRCDSVNELASRFYQLFVEALSFPTAHPLGPLWNIPPKVRQFIRAFTEYRAVKAGIYILERKEVSSRKISSVKKFTSPYWKAKFSLNPPQTDIKPKVRAPTPAQTAPLEAAVFTLIKVKPSEQFPLPPSGSLAPEDKLTISSLENIKTQLSPTDSNQASLAGWKIQVGFYQAGKQQLKNLGKAPVEHGDPATWRNPGPIHQWLKAKLVAADVTFRDIVTITAERKKVVENVDYLLEHIPLTQEELEACQ